ncbi:M20 family metallopeptidase [Nisaea sp.]|uniref:M20 family metallopeptidase n=1 Tax=Nisaea sp. TaxID=2024842 RepID=UPI003298C247
MSREQAIAAAADYFDRGSFFEDMSRRIAIRTESQLYADRKAEIDAYLDEMQQTLEPMGYSCTKLPNPSSKAGPLLIAERIEDPSLPTVLTYGHGDVVNGMEGQWDEDRDPWTLTEVGDRLYGRGIADNKGQHCVNIGGLAAVLKTRGKLGFNSKILIESGEECGSLGLSEFAELHKEKLKADFLISSDGPRFNASKPCVFMGSRGGYVFDITCDLREGAHHSGNWGGLLPNPAIILAHALATITDKRGQIRIPEWRPTTLTPAVRKVLAECEWEVTPGSPAIDPNWGEESLTPIERVIGWNSFEILSYIAGQPERPVNAIPGKATCRAQLRFVVGTDPEEIVPALQRHLEREGFPQVTAKAVVERDYMTATRLEPDHPLVEWAVASIKKTSEKNPTILPNLGGSLPNEVFSDTLGLPTIWVPHSYSGCSQHAPNEHNLKPILREGLEVMAGLFWDIGDGTLPKSW